MKGDAGRKNATSLIISLIQSARKIWTKRSKLLEGTGNPGPQQPHAISLPLAIPTEHVSVANPSLPPGDLAWNAARAQPEPSMPYEEDSGSGQCLQKPDTPHWLSLAFPNLIHLMGDSEKQTNKDSSMTSNDELLYYMLGHWAGQPGEGLGPATGVMRYRPLSLAAGARA